MYRASINFCTRCDTITLIQTPTLDKAVFNQFSKMMLDHNAKVSELRPNRRSSTLQGAA